ncbi:MAG: hypothetical protein NC092_02240 [Butyrivibrio sp.]|nr:hypothetical protein [Butyrivibrio sp.]
MDYDRYNNQNRMLSDQSAERLNPFSIASLVCGILSITLCCSGILSLPLGGLGILFAILTKRMGKAMPSMSATGLVLSCSGFFLGMLMCVYLIYGLITDPELRDAFEDSYEYYYNELYEYNFEHL